MFTLIFFLLFTQAIYQDTLTGTAVKIADGDTFTLLDSNNKQTKIRLHGIDCPERGQDFGTVAAKFLGDRLKGQTVKVKVMSTDRYGRAVGVVYVNGEDINLMMLKAGLAWHYKVYDKSIEYAQAEKEAKSKKLGLWKQSNAIAPWEWRKEKRK